MPWHCQRICRGMRPRSVRTVSASHADIEPLRNPFGTLGEPNRNPVGFVPGVTVASRVTMA